jgi:glutaredoxin
MAIDNPNNRELVLYTLIGCHLCDQVAIMLQEMGIDCTAVEIDTDPELERKYDIHIPVLYLPDIGKELFFPFNADEVQAFMEGEV